MGQVKTECKRNSPGPSKRIWNNMEMKTSAPYTCEWCGREWPASEQGVVLCRFLGFTIVEECCGALLDCVFQESGAEIAEVFLRDFAGDPLANKYSELRFLIVEGLIPDILQKIEKEFGPQIKKIRELAFILGLADSK